VRIEVDLTSPVTPEVTVVNPEQLILELPGAVAEQRAPIRVNQNGVQSVVLDNPAGSPLTHLIITLSETRAYDLAVQGSKVVLTVCRREKSQPGRGTKFRLRPPQFLDRKAPSQESSAGYCNHHFFPGCSCAPVGSPPHCDA